MAAWLRAFSCAILLFCILLGGAEAKRRRPESGYILMASMQDSISLLTSMTTKMTIQLDEARTEIEQLKSELSASQSKMVQLADATSSLKNESKAGIEELKNELATSQNKMVQLADATSSLKNESKADIEELKNELATSQSKMVQLADATSSLKNESKADIEELKSELLNSQSKMVQFKNESKELTSELKSDLSTTNGKVDSLEEKQVELESTTSSLKNEPATWPEGSYCFLSKGGSCPVGFTRYMGHMKGIYTLANSGGYTQPITFGDSSIGCRQSCSYGSPEYNANLVITSCCK